MRMQRIASGAVRAGALVAAVIVAGPARAAAASCDSLASLRLPNTTMTAVETVMSGTFTAPPPARTTLADLPPFCRVAATLTPSNDSNVKIEVWMPLSAWNGKFLGVGNGGLAGIISYPAMGTALGRGYAVSSTDTGHEGTPVDGAWALGHPEKQIDFGYRAVHEMTVQAKAVVAEFYEDAPRHAYWNGCSTGGRQGLVEAQRFPADYDGIIAGAPASNWSNLVGQILAVASAVRDTPGTLPTGKLPMLHAAVMAHCDAGVHPAFDGVSDGILEDPRSCTFDPATLLCEGGDGPGCLTAAQVDAARRIYAPLRDSRTGKQIFPGFSRGGELAWEGMPRGFPIAAAAFKYMVAGDPNWDPRTFDVATDVPRAADADRAVARATATDPDLTEFKRLGGRLIQYHGFGEPEIASEDSINYYDSVVRQFGSTDEVDGFYRLFMVPGMGHCRGGAGATDRFDLVSAMEQWVERGVAPDRVTASGMTDGVVDRTRPLCPHPQVARWTGSGSTDDESNFECVAPPAR